MFDFEIRTRLFSSVLLLMACCTATEARSASAISGQPLANVSGMLRIDREDGRLDATIQGRPTGEVLEALSRATGIRFYLDPSLMAVPLSASVEDLPFEDALKRILGVHSYVMHFAAPSDPAGRHRLTAVRVYPKGRFSAERYVLVAPAPHGTDPVEAPAVLSAEEVDALLRKHDAITRAATAQRIAEKRNRPLAGARWDGKSLGQAALERARRIRTLQQRKARALARKHAWEMQLHVEAWKQRSPGLRNHHERQRRDARQPAVPR